MEFDRHNRQDSQMFNQMELDRALQKWIDDPLALYVERTLGDLAHIQDQGTFSSAEQPEYKRLQKAVRHEAVRATQRQNEAGWPTATIERADTGKLLCPVREVGLVLICGGQLKLPLSGSIHSYGPLLGTDGVIYWLNSSMWFTPTTGMTPYIKASRQYVCLSLRQMHATLDGLKAL